MILEKLKKRAEAGLSNKAEEIDPAALEEAISDMEEIVADRELQSPFQIDIAYYRLLLILDTHLSEEDTELYAAALKELRAAPRSDVETGAKSFGFVTTGQRESDFQCL